MRTSASTIEITCLILSSKILQIHKDYTKNDFTSVNDMTLSSDNPLRFMKNLL